MTSFAEWSYARHVQNGDGDVVDPARKVIVDTYFDDSTADAWLHQRAYEIASYVGRDPGATWVTIGDGRFGLDSIRLRRRGVPSVLPTSIEPAPLRAARERGLIDDFSVENAEALSFADGSFDYVFCKESYHHFPRPMLALYEMLRVARAGVILVEPNDVTASPIARLLSIVRRRHVDAASYEEVGNYIFSISPREIEKVALGVNAPQVAFKPYNTHWIRGLEHEPADARRAPLFARVKRRIRLLDLLCRLRLYTPVMLMACIFKRPLDPGTAKAMREAGWRVVDLPRNPHYR